MRIGQLAAACDCPIETIRYYERVELLPRPGRRPNGYRKYDERHRRWLNFILKSRGLGFTQEEVRRLMELADQSQPDCTRVHRLVRTHLRDVRAKLAELRRMERALLGLKRKCESGEFEDCPALDELMA